MQNELRSSPCPVGPSGSPCGFQSVRCADRTREEAQPKHSKTVHSIDAFRCPPPCRVIATTPDFAENVGRLFAQLLPNGPPAIGAVAEQIGMSERTLHRRLVASGTSWRKVIDRVRYVRAREMLFELDLPITQIALELGYSDHAAFTRAFRRWAGYAPMEFRRGLAA